MLFELEINLAQGDLGFRKKIKELRMHYQRWWNRRWLSGQGKKSEFENSKMKGKSIAELRNHTARTKDI